MPDLYTKIEELTELAEHATHENWVSAEAMAAFSTPSVYTAGGALLFHSTHHGKMNENTKYVASLNPIVMLNIFDEFRMALENRMKDIEDLKNTKEKLKKACKALSFYGEGKLDTPHGEFQTKGAGEFAKECLKEIGDKK